MNNQWQGMMRKTAWCAGILAFLLIGITGIVSAQDTEELKLRLSRDFGYGGGVQIQGSFSLRVSGPDDLVRVAYLIDDQLMGESTESPSFRFKFSTDDYPLGLHTLSATGYDTGGGEYHSNKITKEFVSASVGYSSALKVGGIILGLVIAVSLISFAISTLAGGRKKGGSLTPGSPRSYGPLGGTVCPKCGRSFSRHIWGLNIVVGKFDRCPHCGKWSATTRASPAELRAAEMAEIEPPEDVSEGEPIISEEQRLRKELEDSRFDDVR